MGLSTAAYLDLPSTWLAEVWRDGLRFSRSMLEHLVFLPENLWDFGFRATLVDRGLRHLASLQQLLELSVLFVLRLPLGLTHASLLHA